MKDTKQSVMEPEENGVEESTRGFPVVTEQDGARAALFEMKKRNRAGGWDSVRPVSVTSLTATSAQLADTAAQDEEEEMEAVTEAMDDETVTEALDEEPATEELDGDTVTEALDEEPATEELDDETVTEALDEEPATEELDGDTVTEALDEESVTEELDDEIAAEAPDDETADEASDDTDEQIEAIAAAVAAAEVADSAEAAAQDDGTDEQSGESEETAESSEAEDTEQAEETEESEQAKATGESEQEEKKDASEETGQADEGDKAAPADGHGFGRGKRIAAIIAGVAVIAVVAFSIFVYAYPNIFPGVYVADDYKLSGMTKEEAQDYIAGEAFDGIKEKKLYLSGMDILENTEKYYAFPLSEIEDAVDSSTAAEQAYLIGREGNYFQRVGTVINSMFTGWEVALSTQLKDGAVEAHVDALAANLAYDPIQPSWSVDGETEMMTIDTGKQGVGFDREKVYEALTAQLQAADTEPYTIETYVIDQEKPDPEKISEESSTEPINAIVDKSDGQTIIDEIDGIQIDPSSIATAIGDATEQTYTLPVEYTPAEITAEDLSQVLFRDVLASSTTYYNSGQAGRTTNLRLATEAINGTILNPGEEFSYNTIVGERTSDRGYRTAIIFSDGQQVNDLGGGVCQPSSTTYMAVLRADLEVTERWCHQFQVTYTPISQDAAVAWGSKDFRFKNNTAYPIKIVASASGGALTVQIIGTETVEKEVSFSTSTSYGSSYKYAALYKTVTVNGESTTVKENESNYLYG